MMCVKGNLIFFYYYFQKQRKIPLKLVKEFLLDLQQQKNQINKFMIAKYGTPNKATHMKDRRTLCRYRDCILKDNIVVFCKKFCKERWPYPDRELSEYIKI